MNETQAFKELQLNIKHQGVSKDEVISVGYEYEPGHYIFMLLLPVNFRKFLKDERRLKCQKKRNIKKNLQ